jgi:hypothetical protein
MGNKFSTPQSMEKLPNSLSTNQHVEITTKDNKKYYVFHRGLFNMIGNNISQNFSLSNVGLDMLGKQIGLGNELSSVNRSLNKQKESWFYITEQKDKSKPIKSSVNVNLLKLYIKLYNMDPVVKKKYKFDLKTSTFEIKENEPTKNLFGRKKILKKTLKQLQKRH